ncbi:MAG: glutathione synthase [Oceanicoccus sp.]|uniref:glutathione synthase n=1 Tax=Oceanicoccus sp. TaxID=2691044 RepID=UPI0026069191|nr:glutathione synthase [Oceanicoccus sp.]MCP3908093.1 glutathione synthase [Oceanicoccus sp.]MDG1772713.1 glutathione synthase [Oceanicoccus sp.]
MKICLGVVMDPIESINIKKDTTLAMLWAASDRGWSISYMRQQDLYQAGGEPRARVKPLQVFRNTKDFYQLGEEEDINLGDLDVILMRKDPPFDNEFVYSTYILEAAERLGTLIVNKPQSLRDCNEKMFATQFPECCPPLVVSRDEQILRDFHKEHGDVIFKPLDGMGGASIFRVKQDDPNLGVILETLTDFGANTIMAQKYLPEIVDGDKRILLVDGEPVDYCLARIPSQGETRGNLAAGGTGRAQPLTDRDRWIANQIGATAREKGLLFVGLDVIGEHLTEINVTSPTCVREIDDQFGTNIAATLMDAIEGKLNNNG